MSHGTRETARETMTKAGSISRLVRRTVGTDTMATEIGTRMSEGVRSALAEVQARLAADLDERMAEGNRRLQDALSEEIRHGLAALDERLSQDMHARFEALAGHLDTSVHQAAATEAHRNAAHLDEQMALRIDAAAQRLEEALARSVVEEAQRGAAQLDGRLAHGLQEGAGQVSLHLGDALGRMVDEAVQREFARGAGDLVREIGDRSDELNRHLDERTGDLHERFRQDFHQLVAGMHGQVMQGLAEERGALLTSLHVGMSHVDQHLATHLTKEIGQLLGTAIASGGVADQRVVHRRIVALGRLMEPCAAKGFARCRIGHDADGGYIMLDDLRADCFALSFGVGDEMTWDVEIAGRGIDVHQFDHTIEAPPETHPRIRFHRSRIAPVAEGDDHSLASALALGGDRPCIVKMDIEGDEWAVLDAAGEGDFDRIAQLVIEFHEFEKVGDSAWFERAERVLKRLAASFAVVHVHANNYGALRSLGNVPFPELLEVTFVNRRLYTFEPTSEVFPTPLDAPNRSDLPDISLGSFRF